MTDVDRTSASRAAGEAIQRLLVSEGVIKGGQKPPRLPRVLNWGINQFDHRFMGDIWLRGGSPCGEGCEISARAIRVD